MVNCGCELETGGCVNLTFKKSYFVQHVPQSDTVLEQRRAAQPTYIKPK